MESSSRNSTLTDSIRLVAETFSSRHGAVGRIFRAPGRVNLIGEHTDYNDGFVMPAAIGFSTYVAVGLRSGRILNVYSIDYGESASIDLDNLKPAPKGIWTDYVRGVAAGLLTHGIKVPGVNLVIKGDVPIGAGLSSSAAIEVSTAYALLAVADANLDGRTIAAICQHAEHEYAGTRSGIMDQFISCYGREDHALLLDCRSLEYDLLELPPMVSIVICNTMVKHELAGGEYNRRRADCEAGVRFLQQSLPDIRALRDVTINELERFGAGMPERIFRRCRHVITEDARVLQAAEALRQRDLRQFGKLMMASHASLRDDYEVSCRELDVMVEISNKCGGVFGGRMTGGGFGGCTVNLVEEESVDTFRSQVSSEYQQATGIIPSIYVCRAAQGAGEVADPTA
jgi:galactokinase